VGKSVKKIRKAVFPVAGFGTRFLPATKAMPKELLPIIDKPLIQYAAEEAVAAGIDTLIFVTGRNKRAIEDHFDGNKELELALESKGLYEQARMVQNILPKDIECIFVRQAEQLGLGHAILCAERVIGNEPFAILLADDFITSKGHGVTADLVEAYEKSNNSQISVMEIMGPEISKYGVVSIDKGTNLITGLIEKPSIEAVTSNLANIGRYVLTPDIFNFLRVQGPGSKNEIQLSDAINFKSKESNVEAILLEGDRFDCGSTKGYIEAINHMAKKINL
jgi:UTP--glucose-1-phosphate uridylyltransferase